MLVRKSGREAGDGKENSRHTSRNGRSNGDTHTGDGNMRFKVRHCERAGTHALLQIISVYGFFRYALMRAHTDGRHCDRAGIAHAGERGKASGLAEGVVQCASQKPIAAPEPFPCAPCIFPAPVLGQWRETGAGGWAGVWADIKSRSGHKLQPLGPLPCASAPCVLPLSLTIKIDHRHHFIHICLHLKGIEANGTHAVSFR